MTDMETGTKKSSGVAKAGLTLGIIGTSLAGLLAANSNGGGSGILGGLLGGGQNNKVENQQSYIAALESQIAELKAMRYTDYVGLDLYKNIVAYSDREDGKIKELQDTSFAYIFDLDKRTALNDQAAKLNREYDTMARDYQFMLVNNKIDASVKELNAKIDCCCEKAAMITNFNHQLNELSDASIISYVNSNFIPGQLKTPASSICPPVQLA